MSALPATKAATESSVARSRSDIHELAARRRSAAHELVNALVSAGVRRFFGVPGGPVSPVFHAILETDGATLVESRHETSAAFAAASYYHACGEVAAVVVTAGPGATNVVTGVANAHLSGVPMLVLCGDVAWSSGGRRLLQNTGPEGLDVERMIGHLCRATIRVAHGRSASTQALAALHAATGPRPGPALCVVPMDRGRQDVGPAPEVTRSFVESVERVPLRAVHQTAMWLTRARRPLIVLGAGCRRHTDSIRRLVDALNVPFVTTPQAKGVVSELHPRSLRTGGMAASLWAREYTSHGVDAALVLGTDLDDVSVGPTPYVADGGRLVHVDLDASVFHRNHPADLPVVADIGAFADGLVRYVTSEGLSCNQTRKHMREVTAGSPHDVPRGGEPGEIIGPHEAVLELEKAAGPRARFITDIGQHMLFALHYLTSKEPDQFHIHLGLGSMGSGIAGAVGLGLADPKRRVVCICGDGGMQMNGMEVLVAADLGLPIVYAVFNDARYNMVYHGMEQLYGAPGSSWGTRFIDFAAWAGSMGIPAQRIVAPGQIDGAALDRLSAAGPGPVVLDVLIDPEVRLAGVGRDEELQRMSVSPAGAEA